MPKERTINPAAAALKASKTRAIRKGKAELASRRQERLSKRDPSRLQREVDELTHAEAQHRLNPRDVARLEGLRKELKAVERAREALGVKTEGGSGGRPPRDATRTRRGDDERTHGDRRPRDGRGRKRGYPSDDESETDEDVRSIPMPRDTPPPLPPSTTRRHQHHQQQRQQQEAKPVQKTYSSAPVLRDLQAEATKFLPAAVAQKLAKSKAQTSHTGRLMEPEELDRLEEEGKADAARAAEEMEKEAAYKMMNAQEQQRQQRGRGAVDQKTLDEEAARFEREIRAVQVEDVSDDGT